MNKYRIILDSKGFYQPQERIGLFFWCNISTKAGFSKGRTLRDAERILEIKKEELTYDLRLQNDARIIKYYE